MNAHGLIREFIVSPAAQQGRVQIGHGTRKAAGGSQQHGLAFLNTAMSAGGGGGGRNRTFRRGNLLRGLGRLGKEMLQGCR